MKLAEYQLKHVFEKFKELSIKDSGSEFGNDNNFIDGSTVNVYADMIPTEFKLPSKLKEVKEYFKRMAQNFENVKGKQMELHLLPLNVVQQIFGLQSVGNQILVNIEIPTVKRLKQLYDSIFEASATFQNLVKFITENEEFIAAEDKSEIENYANKFEVDVNEMRGELAVLVQKVRSGIAEAYEIEVLRTMFEKNAIASSSRLVNSCKTVNDKLCFIKECQQNNILMVTETDQFENIKCDNQNAGIFIMFCSFKNDRLSSKWTETKEFFFGLQNHFRTKILAVVDTDVLPNIESIPDGIRVAQYYNGECITNDYMEFQKKMDSQNTVACDNMQPNDETNIKGVPINFPCPKCSNGPKEWVCANCRQEIEYNFDGNFYCRCGFNVVEEFAFKCSDPMHGDDYVKFSENSLKQLIENIKPLQEVNILVIGETGVGKSTWINALANYISYDTIDDVLSNDFINLIPTQFELTEKQQNGKLIQKSIKVGTSDNENFTKGQSATQQAKAYTFRHNNCLYRIIDTPGIGDSRGIEQDKKNMENIMQFISMYKEIHGICVLMRPNESRLTPSFEFCFKELLVQFHRSAVENIVFCFTQTSGFNFEVGQTLTPLNVLLDEIEKKRQITIPTTDERMYAVDNMAYRYLCAVKHSNYEFPSDQQELYKRSFDISRDVSRKMLNYFLDRKAHKVEESISIYRARNIIRRLTHPMAMINTAVEETLEKVKDKQRMIRRFSNDEEELKKILIKQIPFKRWYLKVYNQYYCGTCATKDYYYGDDRMQFLEAYSSVMDTNPFVLNVPAHEIKNKKSKCPQCGPNTKAVYGEKGFYSEMGIREEEDTTVAGQMKEKLKTKEGIEEEIKKVQRLKNELIAENDAIVKASARFAHFLGKYSITTYNDATEKYLKVLIKREERKGNESKKILYENLLSQYDAEKMAFEKQLKNASKFEDSIIKSSDIMEIVEKLKNLKHYGQDIAQAIGECNKAILYEASAEEMEVCLPNQQMSKLQAFYSWAMQPVKKN
uniref:G domain-containing protein n=1 Tax=Panagrolaimus sp. ES5 TaxID=591445 RepID=A0AC34GYX4_9BILA